MKRSIAGLAAAAALALSVIHSPKVRAESYCGKLDYIVCGESVVITGFENSPETLDIPARIDGRTVDAVRENAFYKCGSLRSITLPDTVTSIGHHAFMGCTSLESVVINGSTRMIEEGCFSGCGKLREITLPDSVREIGKNSFYKCVSIRSLKLPEKLEVIGENSFGGCTALESVRLPDSVIRVGDRAFFGCLKLMRVNIPDSAAELGSCSFGYSDGACRKVADMTLTGSKSSLGKAYAADNGFGYIVTDTGGTSGIPTLPIAVVIFSGAGLMLLFIPGKLRHFRARYEYEN